jgi:hypothetical protein
MVLLAGDGCRFAVRLNRRAELSWSEDVKAAKIAAKKWAPKVP